MYLIQEVLVWITKLRETLGGDVSAEKLKDFIWKTLKSGQVRELTLLLCVNNNSHVVNIP